jgi:transposase-like protein
LVSYETVRRWVNHFGPMIAADLRKRRAKPCTTCHLDEAVLVTQSTAWSSMLTRQFSCRGRRAAAPTIEFSRRVEAGAAGEVSPTPWGQ